jgi:hypothetical protein
MFEDPEMELEKVEHEKMAKYLDRKTRWTNEFSKNNGIKILRDGFQKERVPAVIQCLIPISEFTEHFLTEAQEKPKEIALQNMLTSIFKN